VLIAQTRSRAQIVIEEQVPEPVETQPAALPPPPHAKPKWREMAASPQEPLPLLQALDCYCFCAIIRPFP